MTDDCVLRASTNQHDLCPLYGAGQYDLCPLYAALVEEVVPVVSDENHLVVHPCGHWVVKRLLTGHDKTPTDKESKC